MSRRAQLASVLLAGLLGGIGCGRSRVVPAAQQATAVRSDSAGERATGNRAAGWNLILVTLDTLRADRVGCYGDAEAETPSLDRLAHEGIRFADASATVPLTLPSHATLLSGLLPLHHGLHNNGSGAFPSEAPSLAATLHAAGYRTGAFIGAFVLDHRFGLARGFAVYDDAMPQDPGGPAGLEAERAGSEVVDRAIAWLDAGRAVAPGAQPGDAPPPFFAWVHLYDAHAPYTPPEPYRGLFPGRPYEGEVAGVDAQVGRLLRWLDSSGVGRQTVVAVVADHGEGLGDHGELTHGLLLYEPTLRVPWLLRAPGLLAPGTVVDEPVSLVDLAPTLAGMLGRPLASAGGQPLDGRDLSSALLAGASPGRSDLYAETEYPRLFGWAGLRALRRARVKLIAGPQAELYDLASDPDEARDLLASLLARAATPAEGTAGEAPAVGRAPPDVLDPRSASTQLLHRLAALVATGRPAGPGGAVDAETRARLASLGYVADSAPSAAWQSDASLPNPRDRVALFQRLEAANALVAAGKYRPAAAELRRLVDSEPTNPVLRGALAKALRLGGEPQDALTEYRRAVELRPDDGQAWYNLGVTLQEVGQVTAAGDALSVAVRRDPANSEAHNALGIALQSQGQLAAAAQAFSAALGIDERSSRTHNNLANVLRDLGRVADAERAYRRAIALAPAYADPLNGLGALEVARGRPRDALPLFDRALEIAPDLVEVRLNRGIALEVAGDRNGAIAAYRDFLARADPKTYAAERQAAGQLLARLGSRP